MIDINAKFVTVLIFQCDPGNLPAIADEAQLTIERKAPMIGGHIETILMANEEKTQLLVVSLWESRHAWSAAQWDQDVGRMITDTVEATISFEVRTYEPITVVRGGSG